MNRLSLVALLVLILLAVPSFAQDFTLLQPGPFGRPLVVNDEAENRSVPIRVYSDSDTEIFIPDITGAGWLAWHAQAFRDAGQYTVMIYFFYKTDHACQEQLKTEKLINLQLCPEVRYDRRYMTVDTRRKTITFHIQSLMDRSGFAHPARTVSGPVSFKMSEVSPVLARAIQNISAIVLRETANYHGATTSFEKVRCQSAIEATMNMASSITDPQSKKQVQDEIARLRARGCEDSSESSGATSSRIRERNPKIVRGPAGFAAAQTA